MGDHVFISYAKESRERIIPVLQALLNSGQTLFLDKPQSFQALGLAPANGIGKVIGITSAAPWYTEIERAIRTCAAFLPIISEDHATPFAQNIMCLREARLADIHERPFIVTSVGDRDKCINAIKEFDGWGMLGFSDAQIFQIGPEPSRLEGDHDAVISELTGKSTRPPLAPQDWLKRQKDAANGRRIRSTSLLHKTPFVLIPGSHNLAPFHISERPVLSQPLSGETCHSLMRSKLLEFRLPDPLELMAAFPSGLELDDPNPYRIEGDRDPDAYWNRSNLGQDENDRYLRLVYQSA